MAFNSQSLFPKEEARGTWRSQGQAALRTGGQGQRDTSGRRWAAGDEHRADSELPCTSWQPESIQLVTFTKRKKPLFTLRLELGGVFSMTLNRIPACASLTWQLWPWQQ